MLPVIGNDTEVRCMLIPMRSGRLLLPSTAVAEVIGYRTPDADDDQPEWMQGTVSWHQRDIPVLDFERLIGVVSWPPVSVSASRFATPSAASPTGR